LQERVSEVVLGEREAAVAMARHTLLRCGVNTDAVEGMVQEARHREGPERRDPASPVIE